MNAKKVKNSKTYSERNSLRSAHGCRYCEFLRLPYFDPIRMVIIDPMHNLYLGTAKHMLRVWIDCGISYSRDD